MKTNFYLFSVVAFVSAVFLTSCKKEVSPTTGEVIAQELQAVIEKNNLRYVYPVIASQPFPDRFSAEAGREWSFSNGFVHFPKGYQAHFNLTYLKRYAITNVSIDGGIGTTYALILFLE
ncbi:hypothetical protein [Paraflavitalea pollutisoli]|uniref:hypothetical protein n=1 Tax=Paraflavitalea pollutisoli TaxID=3034143 RepID=UPI0023EAC893|nr:hypothetical protein [Paraflavitalea sp. H1-2-19X]